jgi:hypothetical protein
MLPVAYASCCYSVQTGVALPALRHYFYMASPCLTTAVQTAGHTTLLLLLLQQQQAQPALLLLLHQPPHHTSGRPSALHRMHLLLLLLLLRRRQARHGILLVRPCLQDCSSSSSSSCMLCTDGVASLRHRCCTAGHAPCPAAARAAVGHQAVPATFCCCIRPSDTRPRRQPCAAVSGHTLLLLQQLLRHTCLLLLLHQASHAVSLAQHCLPVSHCCPIAAAAAPGNV